MQHPPGREEALHGLPSRVASKQPTFGDALALGARGALAALRRRFMPAAVFIREL
jgi:hypothetical protein